LRFCAHKHLPSNLNHQQHSSSSSWSSRGRKYGSSYSNPYRKQRQQQRLLLVLHPCKLKVPQWQSRLVRLLVMQQLQQSHQQNSQLRLLLHHQHLPQVLLKVHLLLAGGC
jgi:hypothetical protein